jgi:hypothetical protein
MTPSMTSEFDRKSIRHFQTLSNRLTMTLVMAGLVPAIHVFLGLSATKTWMLAQGRA